MVELKVKNIRGGTPGIPNLKYMSNILMAVVDKAKAFNSYFCSVFTKESTNLAHLRGLFAGKKEYSIDWQG